MTDYEKTLARVAGTIAAGLAASGASLTTEEVAQEGVRLGRAILAEVARDAERAAAPGAGPWTHDGDDVQTDAQVPAGAAREEA